MYANIIGYGTTTDAVNRIEPCADAIQLGRAIKIALDDAGLSQRILIIFVPTEQEAKLGMRPKQKPSKMFLGIMPRKWLFPRPNPFMVICWEPAGSWM